jgi:hypothetical protein
MDGTFQYCARFFTQMFAIHGFKNGYYKPLIVCLLPDKKYKEINLNFSSKYKTIDFELTINSVVNEVRLLSKTVGCRFPLTQA